LECLGVTSDEFVLLCAASGNDYSPNAPGIGIGRLLPIVKGCITADELTHKMVAKKFIVLNERRGFASAFQIALRIFRECSET
jgi:hypothetical protein